MDSKLKQLLCDLECATTEYCAISMYSNAFIVGDPSQAELDELSANVDKAKAAIEQYINANYVRVKY